MLLWPRSVNVHKDANLCSFYISFVCTHFLIQEKYGVDCDPSTSPSQWQRSSFVSGDPLKLKLKRDSSMCVCNNP